MISKLSSTLLFPAMEQQIASVRKVIGHQTRANSGFRCSIAWKMGWMKMKGMLKIHQLRCHHHHIEHSPMNDVKEPSCQSITRRLKDRNS